MTDEEFTDRIAPRVRKFLRKLLKDDDEAIGFLLVMQKESASHPGDIIMASFHNYNSDMDVADDMEGMAKRIRARVVESN